MATTDISAAAPTAPADEGTWDQARAERKDTREGWLFCAPYLILFVLFVIFPAVWGLWISLHRYDFTLPNKPFIGLDNYTSLFDGSSPWSAVFWESLRNTILFGVLSVPLLLVLPLAIAMVLNRKFAGRNLFRAVYFAPYVLGVAVIAVLWRYLLDTNVGLLNYYLGRAVPWLTDVPEAWVSLVGVTVWWTLGFNCAIYLAALQGVPRSLYEAAAMDGASPSQKFRNVTLPGIRPVLVFVVSTTIISSMNMFGQSYLMTAGGPGNETRTAIMQISDTGLRQFDSGMASAMSVIFMFFIIIISGSVFLLTNRDSDARTQKKSKARATA
ncbi:carbohydrate ABC transporter permease [Cellulomonas sp. Leaf395]|uniref:carbohydrate ABC transporter permease n=1 Tax=Cellulomonas sp. Leaf395 TaxID=1736362 RepID=UPI0009EC4769|nr:sugar ABC transporter permease [Cellulomonas sp. Leaf395]